MATNRTVLELVQDVLEYVEEDEINDLGESEAADTVLTILENTFYDLVDEYDLPSKELNFQLNPSGTTDTPTHMTLPSGIVKVDGVWYDKRTAASDPVNYEPVRYCDPKTFMSMINSRNSSDSDIDTVSDATGVTFLVKNDENPTFWTAFDDETLVFDSYDSSLDSWLQSTKTWCRGLKRPVFEASKNAKPDIPPHMEQYLFNEAASLAFTIIKQTANAKVESRAQRQRRQVLNTNRRAVQGSNIRVPNYGRRR